MSKQNTQDSSTVPDQPALPIESTYSEPIEPVQEIGGFKGPEPTRFGDWEKNGRCIDF